ncbi:MAG: hypothetical protein AAF840_18235, partial [Bacteroidota bacterium]
ASNAGEIFFDNNSNVSISGRGTFTNTGLLGGNARDIQLNNNIGGTISPGFSPGTFNFSGDQAFLAGTIFRMEAEGTGLGESDQINIAGDIDLTNINLEVTVDFIPTDREAVILINANGNTISGDFASVSLPEFWEVEQSNSRILIRYLPPNVRTWTGIVSSDWETAGNWSPQVIPGEETNVIIPNVNTNDPVIDEPIIFCKSLVIEELGILSVNGSPSDFVILNPDAVSVTIDGKLFIGPNSSLAFGSFGTTAIQINANGELENEGTISKETSTFVPGNFLLNSGTVTNSGTISIEGFGGTPLLNEPTGIFTNEGELKIADALGTSFNVDDEALLNQGSFDNAPTGTLTITYHDGACISNTDDGVFDNFGTINLGQRGNAA